MAIKKYPPPKAKPKPAPKKSSQDEHSRRGFMEGAAGAESSAAKFTMIAMGLAREFRKVQAPSAQTSTTPTRHWGSLGKIMGSSRALAKELAEAAADGVISAREASSLVRRSLIAAGVRMPGTKGPR